MNFVAIAIVSAIVLGHLFQKMSSFDWLNCILLCLNNSTQIAKLIEAFVHTSPPSIQCGLLNILWWRQVTLKSGMKTDMQSNFTDFPSCESQFPIKISTDPHFH